MSAGRCATQWLASVLSDEYDDLAVVTHEPLGPRYRPRETLRDEGGQRRVRSEEEFILHVDFIMQVTEAYSYVETGWPAFGMMPVLLGEFEGRIRLAWLTRHPVHSAISLATLGLYAGRDDEYMRLAMLDPACPGVSQKSYVDRWDGLSPYEKCLFQWTEINLYAEELIRSHPEVPSFIMRYEDLFVEDQPLAGLVSLAGLPARDGIFAARRLTIDVVRSRLDVVPEWEKIFDHPASVALASRLGYDLAVDEGSLNERYSRRSEV